METKDLVFEERHGISIEDTKQILRRLYQANHFTDCKLASTSQDIGGVDAWIDGSAVQMKVRESKNGLVRSDYLVCIHQPFLGLGHSKTNVRWGKKSDWGRDYQGLVDHCSEYYYVAPKHKGKGGPLVMISRCQSSELFKIAKDVVEAWKACDTVAYQLQFSINHFTPPMTQKWMCNFSQRVVFNHGECQIRWVKNEDEEYGKFLLFVPQNIVESNEVLWTS